MSKITIHPPVEVFDDPEFCGENSLENKCFYLDIPYCNLFEDDEFKRERFELSFDDKKSKFIKCDLCRKYWFDSKHNTR